ncbi:hypothetical protein KGQ19_44880 [Catenulispora sp. NL8]|uniref:Cytochrome b561 bacterial/Ni-hydrogenase domain-containing protein n=1 Tax=Catenulispora pinistramenti TaxID=2705254 RepID=A0ABS5L6Y8_9ACTN|nr:hypothetical protein [Catenulispora pinistramenti]MBS2554012.1 hypothetical protein [Catenulispora pinistramenti]
MSAPIQSRRRAHVRGESADTADTADTAGTADDTGAEGNERLTAITGTLLLVLFAIEGVTILQLGGLLYWHYFFGFLLVGPVCVKICSTLYRFARYYTHEPAYVRKGPPMIALRVLGPFVVLTSCAVLVTGILLGFAKSETVAGLPMLFLHKGFFIVWAGAMTIHVLAYLWRLPRLVASDVLGVRRVRGAATAVGGSALRWSVTVAGLAGGLVFAMAAAHLSSAWR